MESVLSGLVQAHSVGWMEDGDFCGSSLWGVLLGRGVVLVLAARVPHLVRKWRRKRVFTHPGT